MKLKSENQYPKKRSKNRYPKKRSKRKSEKNNGKIKGGKGGGVIMKEDEELKIRILLVKEKQSSLWGIPKGTAKFSDKDINIDEKSNEKNININTLKNCAIREIKEEVGVVLPQNSYYFSNRKFLCFLHFAGKRQSKNLKDIKIDEKELVEFKWEPIEELLKIINNKDLNGLTIYNKFFRWSLRKIHEALFKDVSIPNEYSSLFRILRTYLKSNLPLR